jgi:hypothetical protein
MNERELLVDCLHRLNRLPITYYLTGSMASNYWGIPRTTHDLDFVVQLAPSAIPAVLHEFTPDYVLDEAAVRAAYEPPHQFNAIDTRSALKVDFWLPGPTPFDREMMTRRVKVTLFGVAAWISRAEDVILHKLVWNRITPSDRQLGDAAGVVAVQGSSLDAAYLRKWGTQLGLAEDLERLLTGQTKPKQT